MAERLDQLVAMAEHPKVTLQVLPTKISGHVVLGVPHVIINLLDRATFVYVDTLTGGLYLEDDNDVRPYELAWKRLSATALDFDHSTL